MNQIFGNSEDFNKKPNKVDNQKNNINPYGPNNFGRINNQTNGNININNQQSRNQQYNNMQQFQNVNYNNNNNYNNNYNYNNNNNNKQNEFANNLFNQMPKENIKKNPFLGESSNQRVGNVANDLNLYENYSYENKKDIKKIIIVFCVIIFIFGLSIIAKAIWGFTIGKKRIKDDVRVSVEQFGKEVTVKIESNKPIKEFKYNWKGEQENIIPGNEELLVVEKTIMIPNGNNLLDITITDYYGNKNEYQRQYIFESDDAEKPNIELASVGKDILVTVTDNDAVDYFTYKWNDESEVEIKADENSKSVAQKVAVKRGQNNLIITAFDKTGNRQVRKEKIIGDDKPEINVSVQDNKIVVTAKDDEGIKRIAVTIDGVTSDSGEEDLNQKEVTAQLDITPGEHKISVVVTNVNNLEAIKELTASN